MPFCYKCNLGPLPSAEFKKSSLQEPNRFTGTLQPKLMCDNPKECRARVRNQTRTRTTTPATTKKQGISESETGDTRSSTSGRGKSKRTR